MSSSHSASAHGRFPFSQHGFPLLLCSFPPSRILSTMPPEARLRWRVGTSCTKEMSHHRRCWWSKTGWKTLTPLGSDMFALHHVPLERKMFFCTYLTRYLFHRLSFHKTPKCTHDLCKRMRLCREALACIWIIWYLEQILSRNTTKLKHIETYAVT